MIELVISSAVSGIGGVLVTIAVFVCNQRKLKKEKLSKCIQEIEDLSAQHWCGVNVSDNHYRGNDIQQKLHALKGKIDMSKQSIRDAYKEYRQTITGDNFDNPNDESSIVSTLSSPDKNPRVLLIREKSKNLRKSLKI